MDAAHIHLLLNHFPIIGAIIATGILAFGLFTRNDSLQKASLVILILMAVITIPTFFSGGGAEEISEHIEGVSHRTIHEHEEFAEKSILVMEFLGILAAISLFFKVKSNKLASKFLWATMVVSFITIGMMAKTGNLGGEIRHPEISASDTGDEHDSHSKSERKHSSSSSSSSSSDDDK